MVGVFFSSEGLRVLIFEFTFIERGCYKLNNLMKSFGRKTAFLKCIYFSIKRFYIFNLI